MSSRMTDAGQHTEELLCMEGIMAKGYGCVAKYAMQDEALSITAKGLYAYLCSLTGGGTTTWPRRENILKALRLCKTTYYKALSSLTEAGYITISVKRVSGQWDRNIYTIVSNPKRFSDALPEGGRSALRCAGMLSHGYGMIPRLVMQDPRMTIKEKALYAYLLCYANAGATAFPSASRIKQHLQIGASSLQKYMQTLDQLGYIIKEQRRDAGRFGAVDYFICEQPVVKSPDTQKWDMVEHDMAGNDSEPFVEKSDTANSDAEESDTFSQDTILNPNSINSQKKSIPKDEEEGCARPKRGASSESDRNELRRAMLTRQGIPERFIGDTMRMTAALRILCDFQEDSIWSDDPREQEAYRTVFEALRLLCCRPRTKVRERYICPADVVTLLNSRCMDMLPYQPDLTGAFEYLLDAYQTAVEERTRNHEAALKHPVSYAKYVIWDALQIYQRPEAFD